MLVTLVAHAEPIAALLKQRGQTIAVSESSTGGLVSAALLAIPGASAYFLGGAVVYTKLARQALLDLGAEPMRGIRSASEPYAMLLARTVRDRFGASWGIAETGAAGPSGNAYGDAAGHTCLAISGPVEVVTTLETGSQDRIHNMEQFAAALLAFSFDALRTAPE